MDFYKGEKYITNIDDYEFIVPGIGPILFGKVSLAQEKNTNNIFVLKQNLILISNDSPEKTEEKQKKSLIEILELMNVQNETIINMKGFSFENTQKEKSVTIVMEYMEKGSLSNLLDKEQKGLITEEYNNTKRQIIMIGIAKGMSVLHSEKIFHRGLKPENVLLTADHEPKISDFGVSKYFVPKKRP